MKKLLGFLLVAGLTACAPTVEIDDTDSQDTVAIVEFDPSNSIVPFPNNLLFDPATGLLNIPEGCFETAGETTLRANLLNTLDGFASVDTPISATFSEAVDLESVAGKVMVMNTADGSMVDVVPVGLTASRWDSSCSTLATDIPQMALIPTRTLKPNTNYAVVLKNGITSVNGNTFKASAVWGLTSQPSNPVSFASVSDADGITQSCETVADCTNGASSCIDSVCSVVDRNLTPFSPADPVGLATIEGVDLLWRVHQPLLAGLATAGVDTSEILMAWSFKTQSVMPAFDTELEGSPANLATSTAGRITVTNIVSDPAAVKEDVITELRDYWPIYARSQARRDTDLRSVAPFAVSMDRYCAGDNPEVPDFQRLDYKCDQVGQIVHGTFVSPDFMDPELDFWMHPLMPRVSSYEDLDFVAYLPTGEPPAEGWPFVLWAHGIGEMKEQAIEFAASLNEQGIAMVSLDWVEEGVRATVVTTDPGKGCADADSLSRPDQTNQDCFLGILGNANPAVLRDNFRQSAIDAMALIHSLQTSCTPEAAACGPMVLNPSKMGAIGHSLGGLIGHSAFASSPYPFAAINFNVSAVNWRYSIEEMANPSWGCRLIDAMIDLGVLEGEKADGDFEKPTALCIATEWRTEPAIQGILQVFSWVVDGAEAAAFADKTVASGVPLLVQACENDANVSNNATQRLADALGLGSPTAASTATEITASTPLTDEATKDGSLYLQYNHVQEDGVFIKEYGHFSLKTIEPYADCLVDVSPNCSDVELQSIAAQKLGMQQMQADTTQFFVNHLK